VAMKTTGYEKLRVTVMLCITANGNKLPPYVILNRKTVPEENLCKDIIRNLGPTKCMGDIGVNGKLLGCVWEYQPGALSKPRSMLAMDAFRGHLYNRIRNRLRNKNTALVIIPSGMTSQFQALDMSITKSINHLVRKHYDGKIKKASASVILEWISKSRKEVPVNIIPKSF
jgi:hypothetical protein